MINNVFQRELNRFRIVVTDPLLVRITFNFFIDILYIWYSLKIINSCIFQPPKGIPSQDDVLGVVNHIDQMVTLLILELRDSNSHNHYQQGNTATHSPCLEYLLSENLLVKLYDWSIHTGRYIIANYIYLYLI